MNLQSLTQLKLILYISDFYLFYICIIKEPILVLNHFRCHTKPVQAGCRVTEIDKTKNYPDCCPRVNCDGNKTESVVHPPPTIRPAGVKS